MHSNDSGSLFGFCLTMLSLTLFIYTIIIYNQQVLPNLDVKHDTNYNNQLNWLNLFALFEIGIVCGSLGLMFLLLIITFVVGFSNDPYDTKKDSIYITFICINGITICVAFIMQAYFVAEAVPISNKISFDCNTNFTYSHEDACTLFNTTFNPIVILLEVVFSFYSFIVFALILTVITTILNPNL